MDGVGQVLNRGEIRFCLSEKIRLEAIRAKLDNDVDVEINRFNVLVERYNAKCSHFRYNQNDMNAVVSVVEAERADLQRSAGLWN